MTKRSWRTVAILEFVLLLIVGATVLYEHVISDAPTFQFIGRILNPLEGGVSIRERRESTKKPYAITDGQRYYEELVSSKNINVLIIGPDVSGANYDTLMIASLNEEENKVEFVNLPRDIYIEYSDEVKSRLKKVWPSYSSSKGIYKINAAHSLGKRLGYKAENGRFGNPEYDFTADLIEEVFGIYIDDYMVIKPDSFREIVDYFGGVEIDVPYLMKYSDPTQNLEINISKGLQTLNGKQAEGFVRYRQGVDEKGKSKSIGDIERKKNQVTFVKSFMKQHLTLKNLGKIATIFGDLDKYVTSSVDKADEAAEYGKIAEKLYKNQMTQDSKEIECTNVTKSGVYYLEIKQNN